MTAPLLHVENLQVAFPDASDWVTPVCGVSFEIGRGEIVSLVGESGSGKTLTGLSCLRLVRAPGRVTASTLTFDGLDVLHAPERALRALRGQRIAMVAQDPLTSLHPALRIGTQLTHALTDHGVPLQMRRGRVLAVLESVGLPDPQHQARRYPHELSGGMRQRAMIALALANNPSLLIADEPTTAVDATVQAQLLHLLASLRDQRGMSVLLITHNLGVVAGICDRVLVMYAGRIIEAGRVSELFSAPQHPYTKALLDAVPRVDQTTRHLRGIPGSPPTPWDRPAGCAFHPRCAYRIDRCASEAPPFAPTPGGRLAACWVSQSRSALPAIAATSDSLRALRAPRSAATAAALARENAALFVVAGVTRHFSVGPAWRRQALRALDGIDVQVQQGESLGIVGESGSGKSTLIRLLALLDRPTSGRITFQGSDLARMRGDELRLFRRRVQMVFQDPYSSLDPRYTVAQSIREALRTHRVCTRTDEGTRLRELLERVGLSVRFATRYPRELSGGQRQRVCIARALAAKPEVLLADEPVSALDVSIQAQIVELFAELKRQENLTLVIVAHDLALIREISDRIVTLYLGKVVEDSSTDAYCERPLHPYSYALFRAAPDPDRIGSLPTVLATGDPPSPLHPPSGCRFHTRCFNAQARCAREEPPLSAVDGSRRIACFYPVSDRQRVELTRPQRSALAVVPGPTPDGP